MDKRSEALAELAELDSAELAEIVADHKLAKRQARRDALEAVRREASILLQQAEGCAANHYGGDHELFGMPGWLADSRASLENAFSVLMGDDATYDPRPKAANAVCIISNCNKSAPASEPFCADHRDRPAK